MGEREKLLEMFSNEALLKELISRHKVIVGPTKIVYPVGVKEVIMPVGDEDYASLFIYEEALKVLEGDC